MFPFLTPRASLAVRKAARLRQLETELTGLYMASDCCTSRSGWEGINRHVARVQHNLERVQRVGLQPALPPARRTSLLTTFFAAGHRLLARASIFA